MNSLSANASEWPASTIGVDLGGTSIRVGLFDPEIKLIDSRRMDTQVAEGPASAVERIAMAVEQLVGTHYSGRPKNAVRGIGIGSPGPIDLRAGVLGELPNLPGWNAFPLRSALADAAGLKVVLESDANAAAIAEWKLGAGREASIQSMAMITLGTGVGSGLILNGKVWHGILGMGGEAGHCSIEPEGPLCGCGTSGCLEMYASAGGLIRLARAASASATDAEALLALLHRSGGCSPADVAALAISGDTVARMVFDRFGHYLGLGVAKLINILDVPMILIGGGVADSWELFAPGMFESIRKYSQIYRMVEPSQRETLERDRTFIGPASLGSAAGLLGAALLPHLVE